MHIKISTKLIAIVLVAVLGLAAVTGISVYNTTYQRNAAEEVAHEEAAQVNLALQARLTLSEAVRAYKNYLIRKDARQLAIFKELTDTLEKSIKDFETIGTTEEEKQILTDAKAKLDTYRTSIDRLITARAGSSDIGKIDAGLAKGIDRPLEVSMLKLETVARANYNSKLTSLTTLGNKLLWLQLGICGIISLLVAIMGVIVARKLTIRLNLFSAALSQVAEKDLTTRVTLSGNDELGEMGYKFNEMMIGMEDMITSIQTAVLSLTNKSKELLFGAEIMAKDADEVAGKAGTVATAS
jgi:methyl-accepting chemotaxis protein